MALPAAEALSSRLKRPTLIKPMGLSHVSSGFWLGGMGPWRSGVLPAEPCDLLLEHHGEHWPVRWLADKSGLSGGWRTFAIDKKLVAGDVLVFELKAPTVVKVYVLRQSECGDGKEPANVFFDDATAIECCGRRLNAPPISKRPLSGSAPPKAAKPKAAKLAAQRTSDDGPTDVCVDPAHAALESGDPQPGPASSIGGAEAAQQLGRGSGRTAKSVAQAAIQVQAKGHQIVLQHAEGKIAPKHRNSKAPGKAGGTGTGSAVPAPRKAKAPKVPKPPRVPKPKPLPNKLKCWAYEFPPGSKAAEYAKMLKRRYAEITKDSIVMDKKNGVVLHGGHRAGLTLRGYRDIAFVHNGERYEPIHILTHDKMCGQVKLGQTTESTYQRPSTAGQHGSTAPAAPPA